MPRTIKNYTELKWSGRIKELLQRGPRFAWYRARWHLKPRFHIAGRFPTHVDLEASSTYENVIFVKDILELGGARKIILVSSPYHMLRAKLVFNKAWPKVDVIYSPVLKSEFYDEDIGSRTAQMWAIWHEYAGVIYYFFKGYI